VENAVEQSQKQFDTIRFYNFHFEGITTRFPVLHWSTETATVTATSAAVVKLQSKWPGLKLCCCHFKYLLG